MKIVFTYPGGKTLECRWDAAPRTGDFVILPREITGEKFKHKVVAVVWTQVVYDPLVTIAIVEDE